jgi:hypothetical protein
MQKSLEFFQNIGEQMKKHAFNSSSLAEELSSLGFSLQDN